jgi:predicted nucleic acid-binding protein
VQVVDAGVVVEALVGTGKVAAEARRSLGQAAAAPELLDVEVGSVLRRMTLTGQLAPRRARIALDDLADFPLERAPHLPLLARCWELRDAVSFYDASYVALAEALGCTLLTTDRPLTHAQGVRCRVELLAPSP